MGQHETAFIPDDKAEQLLAAARLHYARRQLVRATTHGFAMLEALGIPRVVEPGFTVPDLPGIGDALAEAIDLLDALDAPGEDREEDDREDDDPAEDDGTAEPILGAPERHPYTLPITSPWYKPATGRRCTHWRRHESQVSWAQGRGSEDGETEPGYDLPEGDDERCGSDDVDREPWLGAPENNGGAADQTFWADSRDAGEMDLAEEFHRAFSADWDANRAARQIGKDLVSRAVDRRGGYSASSRPWDRCPDVYGSRISGDCCAPLVLDGSLAIVDKREHPEAGDFVVVYFESTGPSGPVVRGWFKRLAMGFMPGERWPYVKRPGDELMPVLFLDALNPPTRYRMNVERVLAVHKVVEIRPPEALAASAIGPSHYAVQ